MSDQPKKTEREIWDELVTEFDIEYQSYGRIVHNQGRILYNMKVHLKKHGLDKPRTGRWNTFLREREIPESTAADWVVGYQIKECIPANKCFYPKSTKRVAEKRISQQNRQNNATESVVLPENIASKAAIDFADDADKDNRDKNTRMVVECKFVLTLAEKLQFVEALKKLTPLRATQLMYEAVVRAVPKGEGAAI
jgi:hypothetical protein